MTDIPRRPASIREERQREGKNVNKVGREIELEKEQGEKNVDGGITMLRVRERLLYED